MGPLLITNQHSSPFFFSTIKTRLFFLTHITPTKSPKVLSTQTPKSKKIYPSPCLKMSEGSSVERNDVTLDQLKEKMANFAKERDWDQFHSPRNLLLAMIGEVGELSEIFQWKGEVPRGLPNWKQDEKLHLGEELSDVLLYLVRLSDICGIDLGQAVLRKLELNAIKYPVHLCKGSSQKHIQVCSSGDDVKLGVPTSNDV